MDAYLVIHSYNLLCPNFLEVLPLSGYQSFSGYRYYVSTVRLVIIVRDVAVTVLDCLTLLVRWFIDVTSLVVKPSSQLLSSTASPSPIE